MKNTIKFSRQYAMLASIFVAASFIFTSCDPKIDSPSGTGSLGNLVPAGQKVTYVAIGNSLSAGYQSSSIYKSAQMYSYPMQLSKVLNASDFQAPMMAEPGFTILGRMTLQGFDATGNPIIKTGPLSFSGSENHPGRPFNNLGVPMAYSFDLLDETDLASRKNPFFAAILAEGWGTGKKSVLQQAASLNPNVVTYWIGNNDVFLYAANGGDIKYGPTPVINFTQAFNGGLQTAIATMSNAKFLVGNIPDVTSMPYFTTIPYNGLVLTDTNQRNALNNAYKPFGFKFNLGPNPFVIVDTNANKPYKMRLATSKDYILLQALDSLHAGQGSMRPIQLSFVLDSNEVKVVKSATASFNGIIKSAVDAANTGKTIPAAVLVDFNSFFNSISQYGYQVTGSTPLNVKFISGGIFSLDGIHPTSKGYGIIANKYIEMMNKTWGSDIPMVAIQNIPALDITP